MSSNSIGIIIEKIGSRAGMQRAAVALANLLVCLDFKVVVINTWTDERSVFMLDPRVNVEFAQRTDVRGGRRLIEIIDSHGIDTLVCSGIHQTRLPLLVKLLRPHVVIVGWEQFTYRAASLLGKAWRIVSALLCNRTVVLTSMESSYYPWFVRGRLSLIHYFTDVIEQRQLPNSRTVLAVGRLTHQKGFDLLLRAWANTSKVCRDWRLVIIGSGPDHRKLVEQARDLQVSDRQLAFVGETDDVGAYLADAEVFVLTSRFEGLPLALLEAKMQGKPTVAFDCETGPREAIRHAVDGILVRPGDIDKLAESLCNLLDDRVTRERYARNAYHDAIERFSKKAAERSWLGVLGRS